MPRVTSATESSTSTLRAALSASLAHGRPSAVAPAWRHLRHVYAAPKQPAVGQLGIAFAPQTVVVDKGGRLAAGRSRGVKGRLRARDLPDLLLSLCEDD